jgi:hypothetical protein
MKNGRRDACTIVSNGRSVAVGSRDGIMTIAKEGHREREARRIAGRDKLRVRRLSRPPMRLSGPGVLAELEDGSARLLDIGDSHVEELVRYSETPSFAHVVRLGNLLAHRVPDANRLEFYRLGPSDRR